MRIWRWIVAMALSGALFACIQSGAFAQTSSLPAPTATAPVATDEKPRGPVRVAGGIISGMSLATPSPQYPPAARATHVQGPVVVHAIIGKDGKVKNVVVVAGPALLRHAAVDAVGQWKYRPYLVNGQPTEVDTTIMVNFQ